MARFASFVAAILLITACANELSSRAQEVIGSHKSAQESSLRSIANAR